MKLSRTISCLIPSVAMALTCHASLSTTTFEWSFSTSAKTSAGATTVAQNPFGAAATATLSGGTLQWWKNTTQPDNYTAELGSNAKGFWDLQNNGSTDVSTLQLKLDRMAASTLDFTLAITHLVGGSGSLFPGQITFNVAGGSLQSSVTVDAGGSWGQWVTDTYAWDNVSVDLLQGVTITPSTGGYGQLMIDNVLFIIDGDLVPVPEPAYAKGLAVAGLLAVAAFSLRKRVAKAGAPV